jgi:hypothetical protein
MEKTSKIIDQSNYIDKMKRRWKYECFNNDKWQRLYEKYGNVVATEYAKTTKPDNTTRLYIKKDSTLYQIDVAIKQCRDTIREPHLIIVNPSFLQRLIDEYPNFIKEDVAAEFRKIWNMRLFVDDVAKDFLILPKMSWVDQKW